MKKKNQKGRNQAILLDYLKCACPQKVNQIKRSIKEAMILIRMKVIIEVIKE